MNKEDELFGIFISVSIGDWNTKKDEEILFKQQGSQFMNFLMHESEIKTKLYSLSNFKYGRDLKLILFKFYVNPIEYELPHIKDISNYSKSEKSISMSIIINQDSFFSKDFDSKLFYVKSQIIEKLNLLSIRVKKNKFDTNMTSLILDVKEALNY